MNTEESASMKSYKKILPPIESPKEKNVEDKNSKDIYNLYFIIALILAVVYFIIWTYIDWRMYNAYELHIWDVGIGFTLPYLTLHGHFQFQPEKWIYLIFVPIVAISPSPFLVIVVENLLMAVSSIFLFLYINQKLKNPLISLLITVSYLFNYAFFGAPFFPGHYQILFPTFFIISIYLKERRKFGLSAVFLVASATTSNLGAVFSFVYVFILIIQAFLARRDQIHRLSDSIIPFKILMVSLICLVSLVLMDLIHFGPTGYISGGHIATDLSFNTISSEIITNIQLKLAYFCILLLPFGIGIFNSKYALIFLPFALLLIISPFQNYEYFFFPYTYDVGIIIYLAYVDNISKGDNKNLKGFPKIGFKVKNILYTLITILILGVVILPFGPANHLVPSYNAEFPFVNENFGSLIDVTQNDINLNLMSSLIPINTSVLIQENMPQLTNRMNWTEPGSYNYGWPVNYVLTDPYSGDFLLIRQPYTQSMLQIFNKLYSTKDYGILADMNGSILLKRGYSGQIKLFTGYTETLTPNDFSYNFNGTSFNHTKNSSASNVSVNNLTNLWPSFISNPFLLPPGVYRITIEMATNNLSSNNYVVAGLSTYTGNGYSNVIAETLINPSYFNGEYNNTFINFTFTVDSYYLSAIISTWNTNWVGTLYVKSAQLTQLDKQPY